MMHFGKKFKLLIDRFSSFFTKRRKSVEEMNHQKRNRDHQTSKIAKSRQSYSNGYRSYHRSFYYLARAIMHDVTCELACVVRMRTNNRRER